MASPTHARRAKLKSQLVSAKAKLKSHVTPRCLLLLSAAAASAFLLLLTLRTLSAAAAAAASSSPPPVVLHRGPQHHHQQEPSRDQEQCDRLPASVAETLVHYATTANATRRRRTAEEVAAAVRVVLRRAPCNLLVFGGLAAGGGSGGHARLWAALNHAGRTVFLDEDDAAVSAAAGAIEAYRVAYLASAADADEMLALRDTADCAVAGGPLSPGHFDRSPCKLAVRGLPAAFYEAEWDVIVVDVAVPETDAAAVGVMGAIYTAAVAARARASGGGGGETTEVVVHEVDMPVMDRFSTAFLCGGYLKDEVGKLRHYAIPSHNKEGMPFCP